jgi:hypothetical protein
VKLTAPPPPPPEPPEPPEPGAGGEPGPEKNEIASEAGVGATPEPVTTSEPQPQPEPKPGTWPAWFAGLDVALAAVAIIIGFLAASFAAHNSDLWVHLGAGRMLTTGEYTPGSDPLSYTGADRPWVNHSWLFDLGAYALYSLGDNGFALVLAKALAVAATLVLVLALRRPGQPLWPWALFGVVAVLAAAPWLTLSPLVGSAFFLALTLFVLFRVPNPPGSWRIPIAIGAVFWLWANVDAWFLLGPVTLALLLIGEVARRKSATETSEPAGAADALLPLPDTKTLTRALVIGIVACMLNPHHVRVWQVPFELTQVFTGAKTFAGDPAFADQLVSPLTAEFWSNPVHGYSLNGLAYAILILAGIYAVALTGPIGRAVGSPADVDPLPLPHAALWCVFAAFSLLTAAAIPFLAIITVPLVASRFNILSSRVTLGNWGDRKTRLTLTGSAVGRIVTAVVLLLLGVMAWPGWLHPPGWSEPPGWYPSQARRVAWAVEPDTALVKAAQQFQQWRDSGRLPPEAHGILASIDLANYCAWYAPKEKVFLNGRFGHHRPEIPDFVTLRAGLQLFPQNDPGDPKEAREVMDRRQAEYLAVSASRTSPTEIKDRVQHTTSGLWRSWRRWTPWAIHGRTAVVGWREDTDRTSPSFDRLHLDPVWIAFQPGVKRLPPGQVQPVPLPREWLDDFLHPVQPAPPQAYEALAWILYKHELKIRQAEHYQLRALLLRNVPGGAPALLANFFQAEAGELHRLGNSPYLQPGQGTAEEGSLLAIPIIALRTAWRAIAANPDHPDGYFALAQALEDRDLPLNDDERMLGMINAYRQCLSRLPAPQDYRPGIYTASPTQVAQVLTLLYLNPDDNGGFRGVPVTLPGFRELGGEMIVAQGRNQVRIPAGANVNLPPDARVLGGPFVLPLDLAQRTAVLAQEYAAREFAADSAERRQQRAKGLENLRKSIEAALTQATNRYRTALDRPQTKLRDRYFLARTLGLVGEALTILKEMKEGEMSREFGPDAPRVALEMVAMELVCGRLEDAAGDLAFIKEEVAKLDTQRPEFQRIAELVRVLEFQKLLLEGNYDAAGSELESLQGQSIGFEPIISALAQAKIDPKHYKDFDRLWPVMTRLGVAWPAVAMLEVPAAASPLGVVGSYWLGRAGLQHLERLAAAREGLSEKAQQDAQFFFRRGFLSLIEGDIASAKTRFRQANSIPVPTGWGVEPVRHGRAAEYLRQIERAEAKAAQP